MSPRPGFRPDPSPEPRIGDAERDAAVRALGEHYAAGRITKDEFDERSDLAMRARTDSDLRTLFRDLPRLGPAPLGPPARQHGRPPGWQSFPVLPLVLLLVFLAVLTRAWWMVFLVIPLVMCRPRGR